MARFFPMAQSASQGLIEFSVEGSVLESDRLSHTNAVGAAEQQSPIGDMAMTEASTTLRPSELQQNLNCSHVCGKVQSSTLQSRSDLDGGYPTTSGTKISRVAISRGHILHTTDERFSRIRFKYLCRVIHDAVPDILTLAESPRQSDTR